MTKTRYGIFKNGPQKKIFTSGLGSDGGELDYMLTKSRCYQTDGIFCSFNCVKAYIRDNKHNPLYTYSEELLTLMFTEFTGEAPKHQIKEAPSWRMLKAYGGEQTIEEFRESFNKVHYTDHGIIKQYPSGYLIEEHVTFV